MEKFLKWAGICFLIFIICMLSGGLPAIIAAIIMGIFLWWLIRMNEVGKYNEAYRKAGLHTREVIVNPSTAEEIENAKKTDIPPACNEAYLSENPKYYCRKKDKMTFSYYSTWYDLIKRDTKLHVSSYITTSSNWAKLTETNRMGGDFLRDAKIIHRQIKYEIMERGKGLARNELIKQGKSLSDAAFDDICSINCLVYDMIKRDYESWMEMKFNSLLKTYNFYGMLEVDFYYEQLSEFIENGRDEKYGVLPNMTSFL